MVRQLNNRDDFDAESELIKIEAEGIANRHGIDLERVIAIYKRSPDTDFFPVLAPFQTNLDRAIAILGKDKALQLFEAEDLGKLAERVFLVDEINHFPPPLYSLDDLEQVTENFISYLQKNRIRLLKAGQPPTKFDRSLWLDWQLAKLYHFDFPPGFPRPPKEDRDRLKAERQKFLDLKVAILKILSRAIKRKASVNLWDDCLRVLTETVSAEEAEFYLRMDQFYIGYDVTDRTGKGAPEEIPGLDRPGGFTDLMEVIGHFEKELTIGTLTETRNALMDLLTYDQWNRPILFVNNYFVATEHPLRDTLDSALDLFSSLESKESDFWESYRNRVNEALENEFNVDFIYRDIVKRKFLHQFEPQAIKSLKLMKSSFEATGRPPRISISPVEATETREEFVFRKENDRWIIIYDGQKCPEVKNEAGLKYIQYLLRHEGDIVPALDLYQIDAPLNADSSSRYEETDYEQPAKKGPSGPRSDHREKIFDKKTIAQCKSRLKELLEERDEVIKNNDIGRKEKLDIEIQKIKDYLACGLGLRGRLRIANTPVETARKVVTNSISRTKKEIYKLHKPLWYHLEAIRTGTSFSYKPEKTLPWSLY